MNHASSFHLYKNVVGDYFLFWDQMLLLIPKYVIVLEKDIKLDYIFELFFKDINYIKLPIVSNFLV